jgi:hypothetical protein
MSELNGDAGGAAAVSAQTFAVREKPPISIYPQLKNVVSSVDLGTRIDLKSITMRMRNAEYAAPARTHKLCDRIHFVQNAEQQHLFIHKLALL